MSLAISLALLSNHFVDDAEDGNQEDRLQRLAAFQAMMVKHAMKCGLPLVY